MIEIASLRESDKGRAVTYFASHGDKIEHGVITSWNNKFIFVRYHFQSYPNPWPRTGQTSEATAPEDLEWGDGAAREAAPVGDLCPNGCFYGNFDTMGGTRTCPLCENTGHVKRREAGKEE